MDNNEQGDVQSKDMSFGWALIVLEEGRKVSRRGWNGAGQYLELQVPYEHSKPYIFISQVDGSLVPWVASESDLLARDWFIL